MSAAAGINQKLNYQGRLLTNTGAVVPDGNYNMRFKIYKDGDGQSANNSTGAPATTLFWTELWQNQIASGSTSAVVVKNGYFSVALGTYCTLAGAACQGGSSNTAIDFNQDTLWLSADIGGTAVSNTPTYDGELLPMKRLTSSPYALNSGLLGGIAATGFIQNTSSVQAANFFVQSAISGSVAGIIKGHASQSVDILQVVTGGGSTALNVTSTGSVGVNYTSTGSALSVTQSGNPASGSALIFANNSNGAPSGNLIDLRASSASKLSVDTSGNLTLAGTTQTFSSGSNVTIGSTNAITINVTGATGTGAVGGGSIALNAGQGGPTNGTGGTIGLFSGPGGGTNGTGGILQIVAGVGAGSGGGGNLQLQGGWAGSTGTVAGGTASLTGGTGGGAGSAGGAVTVQGGLGGSVTGTSPGGDVNILGGNANTSTNNGGNVVISGGAKNAGTSGSVIVKPQASNDSATAFVVQNAAGNQLLTVDTPGSQILLGKAGTGGINGKLVFNTTNASSFASSIAVSASQAANIDYTLPTTIASTGQCLQAGTVAAPSVPLVFASCSAGSSLQGAYTSSAGATPSIAVNTTNKAVVVQNSVTSGIAAGNEYFGVRAAGASDVVYGNSLFTVNSTGVGINIGGTGNPATSADLTFGSGADRTINVAPPAGSAAGNKLTLSAGAGGGGFPGGALVLNGGASGFTAGAAGGGVNIKAADSSASGLGGGGGSITVTAGNAAGSSNNIGGSITLQAGSATGSGTNGGVLVKNVANATGAFVIQNASAEQLLNIDSSGEAANLISDGSVEGTFPGNWATFGAGSAISQVATQAYAGTKSAQVVTTTCANCGIKYNLSTLVATTTYIMSFEAKLSASTWADLDVGFGWGGTTPGTASCKNNQTVVTGGWTYLNSGSAGCTYAPTGVPGATGYIYIQQVASASRTFWIDGFHLVTGTNIGAYYAGSIDTSSLVFSGSVNIQPTVNDSTSTLQIQSLNGTGVLDADTLNQRVGVGVTKPLALLHLGSVNSADDELLVKSAGVITGNYIKVQQAATTFFQIDGSGLVTLPAAQTTADSLAISPGAGVTSGSALKVTASGTSAIANGLVQITHTGAFTSTGGLLNVTGNSTTAGTVVAVSGTGVTTGNIATLAAGVGITSGSALKVTASGTSAIANGLVQITHTGAYTGSGGLLNIVGNSSASGTIASISGTGSTGGIVLNLTGNSASSGNGITLNVSGGRTKLGPNITQASAAGATWDGFSMSSMTATLTGSTNVTNAQGFNAATLYQPTITSAGTPNVLNAATLFITGAPIAGGTATITNSAGLWNNGLTRTGLGSTASTTGVCSSLANATAPTAGTAYELRDCSANPLADYAEMYPTAAGVTVGDVVGQGTKQINTYNSDEFGAVDWTSVRGTVSQLVRSSEAYGSNLIGVVSHNNSNFSSTGYNVKQSDNPQAIALNGRVPVKISTENGAIEPGDFLTSSATLPGYAMKATTAGYVIGQALAPFTVATPGTVMVFVRGGYYPGPTVGTTIQNGGAAALASLNVTGTATFGSLNVSGNTSVIDLSVAGSASIQGSLTVIGLTTVTDLVVNGHIITGGAAPTATLLPAAGQNATVTVDGNDTSGTITIIVGDHANGSTPAPTAGELANIVFDKAFTKTPRIILTPGDALTAPLQVYPGQKGSDHFTLGVSGVPTHNQTYTFEYFIVQ